MLRKGSITKQNIINESLQLFSVKGYYNTSLNDILEATKLTKGGLYGHFKSKEDIWYAVYEESVNIWKEIVFKDVELIADPIRRIQKALENDLRNYLGANVFDGGCIFLNMLVELSGQSSSMSKRVLKGIIGFSKLIKKWLIEADDKQLLKPNLDVGEIADFIVTSLNGCAALYASTRDAKILEITLSQINFYLEQMKK
jgi:AcrR family transcriptional regulator